MNGEGEERLDDLARKVSRDKGAADDREYKRGERDARSQAHTDEQDRDLREINRTLGEMKGELARYNERLTLVEQAFDKFSSIAKALGEKGVSTRTFALGVGMLIVAIAALYISSGKHP